MSHGGTDKLDPSMFTYVADATTALDTAQGGPDDNTAQGGQLVAYAFAENQRGELTTNATMPALKTGGGKPGQGYPAIIAPTLTASMGSNAGHPGDAGKDEMALAVAEASTIVRRLTPTECERLQGFPDGWTEGQADSQRYKQLGNSVAVPVFEWVGRRLVTVDAHLASREVA
jgi:DNA (cytosine-5)-methyltransferase 1